jgi:hypothetical protein
MILQAAATTIQNAGSTGAIAPELGPLGGQCALYTLLVTVGLQTAGAIAHRLGFNNVPVLTFVNNFWARFISSGAVNVIGAVPPAKK